MPSNRVQFQPGLSLPEFLSGFGTEAQCAEAVKRARWPDGFRCPRCDAAEHYVVGHGSRKLFQCNACRHQTSVTAGSLMEHTKLPLTTWFLAIYLIGQAKTGISALALKRHLGVSYPTTCLLHQKINHAMAAKDATDRLGGSIQLDDAYLGGELAGGTAGRGSENKVPFVAAVSLDGRGHPRHVKLTIVAGFTSLAIAAWAKASLAPGSSVHSDGLACLRRCRRRRLPAPGDRRRPPQAERAAAVQVDQHRPRQLEDDPRRDLPRSRLPQVRAGLPLGLRLPLQPPLRSARTLRPACGRHRPARAHPRNNGQTWIC